MTGILLLEKPKVAVIDTTDIRDHRGVMVRVRSPVIGSFVGRITRMARKCWGELLLPKPKVAGSSPVVRFGQQARDRRVSVAAAAAGHALERRAVTEVRTGRA
jgi:hypothetical protein